MILAIVGPTGVGKTKLSIALAKKYDAIIINCDAMQVYRGLDIGTAKVREEEKEGREYFFIDEKTRIELHQNQEVIEERVFHTVYGDWYYLTTNKNIDLETKNYITDFLWERCRYSYLHLCKFK